MIPSFHGIWKILWMIMQTGKWNIFFLTRCFKMKPHLLILCQAILWMLKFWTYIWDNCSQNVKSNCISQDKQLKTLPQQKNLVYGTLSRICVAIKSAREASMFSENENGLVKFFSVFDQKILLLGQFINTCSYFRRLNNLLVSLDEMKQTVVML